MNEKRWLERQQQRRDAIVEAVERMDDETLADLVHRAGIDQLPGPSAAITEGRSSVGTHSDPTADAATNESRTDRVDLWLKDLFTEMAKAAHHVANADHLRALVLDVARKLDRENPKPGAGDCLACGRWVTGGASDRIKAGFCPACWMAWNRGGRSDRVKFCEERRARADERERQAS